jgi:hypothetical protein
MLIVWNVIKITHVTRIYIQYILDPNFKNLLEGGMPPDHLVNSCLGHSAHTFGARVPTWGNGKENGPLVSFAPPLHVKYP